MIMERKSLASQRYEQNNPVIRTIDKVEVRYNRERGEYIVGMVGLFHYYEPTEERAMETARRAAELMSLGFMLWGFSSVCVWDYEKIMSFVKTAHPRQIRQYWLYL